MFFFENASQRRLLSGPTRLAEWDDWLGARKSSSIRGATIPFSPARADHKSKRLSRLRGENFHPRVDNSSG